MCFSAAGSLALSGVLAGVGAASIAQNTSRERRMFAAVPLMFAVQQAAEGVVWLTIDGPPDAAAHRLAVSAFLGFAFVVWPIWSPFSLQRIERNPARRRVLTALCWFSVIESAFASLLLTRWRPVAEVAGHSISYHYVGSTEVPRHVLLLLAYVVPTVVPFFVSTATLSRAIGATLMVSLMAAFLIERDALTSVWCFFAAIVSGLILVAVVREQRSTLRSRPELVPPIGQ
jgi:hypothetical protein